MKKSALIIMASCLFTPGYGQLKHYVSLGGVVYCNFIDNVKGRFQDTKEFFRAPSYYGYKIEKDRWGAEFVYSFSMLTYRPLEYGKINAGNFRSISQVTYGLSLHYSIVQHRRLRFSPFAGIAFREYSAIVFEGWRPPPPYPYPPYYYQPVITHTNKEEQLALQLGGNLNIPIFKGIYTTTSLRYLATPWSAYNSHNLSWEVGIGYCIQAGNLHSE